MIVGRVGSGGALLKINLNIHGFQQPRLAAGSVSRPLLLNAVMSWRGLDTGLAAVIASWRTELPTRIIGKAPSDPTRPTIMGERIKTEQELLRSKNDEPGKYHRSTKCFRATETGSYRTSCQAAKRLADIAIYGTIEGVVWSHLGTESNELAGAGRRPARATLGGLGRPHLQDAPAKTSPSDLELFANWF